MTVFEECDEESGVQCKCVRTFFLFLDLNRYNLQFIDQFINQRNMTTCCNNTYPRDDDHLSSRGCRHSAWKKTKTFFFFLFSHCLCTRVFFLSFFFFFFSCTRITEQKGKCFGSIFFGNKRINIFSQKLNRNCVSFAFWSSRLSCRTFLREFIWRKIVLRAMIMSGWSPLQWKQHKHKPVCKSGLGSFCCYHSAVQHLSRTSIEDDSHHKIDLNYYIDSHLLCLQYDLRKKKLNRIKSI